MVGVIGRWILHGGVALWLSLVVPLLCMPGMNSDHHHGPHVVFARGQGGLGDAEGGPLFAPAAYTTPYHTHAAELLIEGFVGLLLLGWSLNALARKRRVWLAGWLGLVHFVPLRPWRPPLLV